MCIATPLQLLFYLQIAICEILHYKAALRRQRMPRDEQRRFCCCNIDPCMAAVCGFLWTGMFGALATYCKSTFSLLIFKACIGIIYQGTMAIICFDVSLTISIRQHKIPKSCFLFSAVTEIGKYSIGRLRPNFVSGCRPNISLSTCVTGQYITDFTCLAVSMPSTENFLRTSFPSGHASSSAFSMIYVIVSVFNLRVYGQP